MAKVTDVLIYFIHLGDLSMNAEKKYCAAIQNGFPVEGILNITVFRKDSFQYFNDISHATSLADALLGHKWMTIVEAEGYGIDLSDPDQDLTAL